MKFTPDQRAAIERSGQDVCVIAGPGSGKTRVLTERFAWLVQQGVSPKSILAITFTEKAAKEIRSRVQKRLPGAEVRQAPISTLHGFCFRLLKEFAIAAELDPGVELWDGRQAKAALQRSVEEVLDHAAEVELLALRRLFAVWGPSDPARELMDLYEKIWSLGDGVPAVAEEPWDEQAFRDLERQARELLAAPAGTDASQKFQGRFREWWGAYRPELSWPAMAHLARAPKRGNLPKVLKEIATPLYDLLAALPPRMAGALTRAERALLVELLQRAEERYESKKRAAARLDFRDLEHRSIRLLQARPDIQLILQNRYEHILMDEMQDTNPVQWRLLELLRTPGGFFAVGDINQSIYRFRYAEPKLFAAYRESLLARGAEIDFLSRNFRSRAEILSVTEEVVGQEPGIERPKSEASRIFRTANAPVVLRSFPDREEEYRWIADEIAELAGRFVVEEKDTGRLRAARYGDVAVLVRTAKLGEAVAAQLAERGIPAALGGGRAFSSSRR